MKLKWLIMVFVLLLTTYSSGVLVTPLVDSTKLPLAGGNVTGDVNVAGVLTMGPNSIMIDSAGNFWRFSTRSMGGIVFPFIEMGAAGGTAPVGMMDRGLFLSTVGGHSAALVFADSNNPLGSNWTTTFDIGSPNKVTLVYSAAGVYELQETLRVGTTSNFTQISGSTGNQTFEGSAGFYPRRLWQADVPATGTGATQIDSLELVIWVDSDNNNVNLVYNDPNGGIVSVAISP